LELTDNAVGFVCYDKAYGFVDMFHGISFRWLVFRTTLLLGFCIQLLVCYPAIPERNRRSW
jgi:hypothetical protein